MSPRCLAPTKGNKPVLPQEMSAAREKRREDRMKHQPVSVLCSPSSQRNGAGSPATSTWLLPLQVVLQNLSVLCLILCVLCCVISFVTTRLIFKNSK